MGMHTLDVLVSSGKLEALQPYCEDRIHRVEAVNYFSSIVSRPEDDMRNVHLVVGDSARVPLPTDVNYVLLRINGHHPRGPLDVEEVGLLINEQLLHTTRRCANEKVRGRDH